MALSSTKTAEVNFLDQSSLAALAAASDSVRLECADAFAAEYAAGSVPVNQHGRAEDVLKMFAEDSVADVRAAVARHLASCPFAPVSLARLIAGDIDSVALPVIRKSPVFEDDDLISVVRGGTPSRRVAVATRASVSGAVSAALVATAEPAVVSALLANDGAWIDEPDLVAILARFAGDRAIVGLVTARKKLPLAIIAQLLETTGRDVGDILEDAMTLPGAIVSRIRTLAQEQLIVTHYGARTDAAEIEDLATRLEAGGRLTATLILRILCTGDVPFFSICLAAKTGFATGDVLTLVTDGKADAVLKVCKKAGLPPSVRRAIAAVLKVYAAAKGKPAALAPDVFTPKAVDRLVREYDEVSEGTLDSMIAEICWRMI